MTADASLLTSRREDVLLVPNRAVQADREAGTYSVTLVEQGPGGEEVTRRVEVTIGLRDDTYTQITGGLEEGDTVRIGAFVPPENPFEQDGPPDGQGPGGGNGPFGLVPAGERGIG
jgi:multidrug efflux pump subunit AcrA (membrane-fusion protein)